MQTRPFLKGRNSILITSTHLMNRNLYLVSIVFWFNLPKLTAEYQTYQNLKMKRSETEKITGIYLSFLQILSILKEKTGTMTKMEKER
jgi:hypothetical protein